MKKLLEFLQGPSGDFSSKRLFALVSFGIAIGLAFAGRDPVTVGIFMGAATGVFIGQAVSGT